MLWKPTNMSTFRRAGSLCRVMAVSNLLAVRGSCAWVNVPVRVPIVQRQRMRPRVLRADGWRLFGSKAGIPGNPLGNVEIYNEQGTLADINEERLKETIHKIGKILGYETYDVTLLLVDDEEMKETNLETRGIDAPTDILSFPFHFHETPGVLAEPEFDVPDYYTLGDLMVDVPYVIRRCQEDQTLQNGEEDADSEEDDSDRGVSGAMATVFDPEDRINLLLVHGMLHLVGYDHEEDDEFEEMVSREEEIMRELQLV